MIREFTLVLADEEVSLEKCNALYEAGYDDGTISTSQGVTRIDFTREAANLEEAIRSAIANVNRAGLQVVRAEISAESICQLN
jgi:hypothetical protein